MLRSENRSGKATHASRGSGEAKMALRCNGKARHRIDMLRQGEARSLRAWHRIGIDRHWQRAAGMR